MNASSAQLRPRASRADVLVDDRGEDVLRVPAAERALDVRVLDECDVRGGGAEERPVLRDAVQLDARDRVRLGRVLAVPKHERDGDERGRRGDGDREREHDHAPRRALLGGRRFLLLREPSHGLRSLPTRRASAAPNPPRHPYAAARSANFAYRRRNESLTVPVGPLRCFARMISAMPCWSDSSPR